MAYEQKEGDGALFKNDRKTSEKHPDYRGTCKLGGKTYTVAGWLREGRDGKPRWMSLRIETPRPQRDREPEPDDFGDAPF